MIDVARCYFPLETLIKIIDFLSILKMNVLHLHFTDDDAFMIESLSLPQLACPNEGGVIYTQKEIKKLIEHGIKRGIRIIPEIDVPGHAASFYKLDIMTYCPKVWKIPGWSIPLNPIQNNTYDYLQILLSEFTSLFPDPLFHLGGDEVSHDCFREDESINTFLNDTKNSWPKNYSNLEVYFQKKLNNITSNMNKKFIYWEEAAYNEKHEHFNGIAQIWKWPRGENPSIFWKRNSPLIARNTSLIYSFLWYIYPLWHVQNNCNSWEECYTKNPFFINEAYFMNKRVIGGEGCLWEEYENQFSIRNHWLKIFAMSQLLWVNKPPELEIARDQLRKVCPDIAERIGLSKEQCTITQGGNDDLNTEVWVGKKKREKIIRERLFSLIKEQ